MRVAGLDARQAYAADQAPGCFVAHQPYLYGELSALENLLFFGKMYSVERAQERADELLPAR